MSVAKKVIAVVPMMIVVASTIAAMFIYFTWWMGVLAGLATVPFFYGIVLHLAM